MSVENPQELYRQVEQVLESGDQQRAITLLQELIHRFPSFADAHNDLAALLFQSGDIIAALQSIEGARECAPNTSHIEQNYVEILLAAGRVKEALEICKALVRQKPTEIEQVKKLASVAVIAGDTETAFALLHYFEQQNQQDPFTAELRKRLHGVQGYDGQNPQRLEQLTEGVTQKVSGTTPYSLRSGGILINRRPFITFGIPSRNRLGSLATLLASLKNQTYRNFEVLISDDGDQHDLEKAIAPIIPEFPLRVIKGPKKNLPANRQNILDNARTELIIMCDDDHVLKPDCIEHLVLTIQESSDIGIVSAVCPRSYEFTPLASSIVLDQIVEYRVTLDDIDEHGDFWWKNASVLFRSVFQMDTPFECQHAGSRCLIYRKSAVMIAGGFPQDCSSISFREDADMSHRIWLKGYKVLINPKAIAPHLRAEPGECPEDSAAQRDFASDGLRFLKKLKQWRERKSQQNELAKRGISVLMFYDETGREWWHRAHHLQRSMPSDITIHIRQMFERFNHLDYDFIFLFEHSMLTDVGALKSVPAEKIILGNSYPRYIPEAREAVSAGHAIAGCINNYSGWLELKDSARWYCCQNGVDTTLFVPPHTPPIARTAAWIGNSQSIANNGLEIIQEACAKAGYELLVIDTMDNRPSEHPKPQEYVRDTLYYKAGVLLCASDSEDTPSSALEALACGLPVVTTRVGNMPELIIDGWNGWIVERSVDAFVEALEKHANSELRSMQMNARLSIEIGWSWKEQANKYANMFRELLSERIYGLDVPVSISAEKVEDIVRRRLNARNLEPNIENHIYRREEKYSWISHDALPDLFDQRDVARSIRIFKTLPPFFLHVGGVGDALMLLSTFYDWSPEQIVLSAANSFSAARAFFDEFPLIKQVYFLESPQNEARSSFICRHIPENTACIGMGATPKQGHFVEWIPGIDISALYGIQKLPKFVHSFRKQRQTYPQVVIAPHGSVLHMQSNKQNIIDPTYWKPLISLLLTLGITPIIIGTPPEAETYPALPGTVDKRGWTFREQFELIASADCFIGSDSWAKTFAAFCGIPTIVFPSLFCGTHQPTNDPSNNVFLLPFENISLVYSVAECERVITEVLGGVGRIARPVARFSA